MSSESPFQLSISPLKISGTANFLYIVCTVAVYLSAEIPSEDVILTAARTLIDSVTTWKAGKSYQKNTVKTYSRPKFPGDGAPWHCRISEHTAEDANFDEFWSKLGVNKAMNEKEYVCDTSMYRFRVLIAIIASRYMPEIKQATLVKQISEAQSIWSLYYTFPPPVSPRVFTILHLTHLDTSAPRTG